MGACEAGGFRALRTGVSALAGYGGLATISRGAVGSPQSALEPAGVEAARLADLLTVMTVGALIIWVLVVGTAIYATRCNPGAHAEAVGSRLIVWGGVVFPTVVLAALLAYGLTLLADLRAPGDGLRISVSGERYWWRVRYPAPESSSAHLESDGAVESANELRLPLDERTELLLESPDVIHSLWIPAIAGKMDLIPGRTNRMVVEPTRAGRYRGVCAEFCGTAHGLMALDVLVMPRPEFERWLADQAEPATVETHPGQQEFLATGCGACHRVRGTEAAGRIGPDLTHVGSRATIGAGLMPTSVDNLAAFIADTDHYKPGVRMPAFGMLPDDDVRVIAKWLESLK